MSEKTVTMPLDEYLEMKGRLSLLDRFLGDFKNKLKKVENNYTFKDVMGTWIALLKNPQQEKP